MLSCSFKHFTVCALLDLGASGMRNFNLPMALIFVCTYHAQSNYFNNGTFAIKLYVISITILGWSELQHYKDFYKLIETSLYGIATCIVTI